MILHAVYLSLSEQADPSELAQVMEGLQSLVGEIDGMTGFHHGPNIDLEGKSTDCHYGFICHFNDIAASERYATDARHRALGARLVALCDGAQQIKVYDIDTGVP